jgi:leucyl/phenylalanyl-tRNA--protein transferase
MLILPPSRFFPPVETADRDGLLAFGGSLAPEWLLDAYRHGIFPWPMTADGEPLMWWSPDPRAVIELDRLHISRRLRRTCRQGLLRITYDRAFPAVIQGCSSAEHRADATWLTPAMIDAYVRLHQLGHAHSVEAWAGDRLAGGVYGVAIAGLFAAESMFYRVRDASKVALVHLVAHLERRGYRLLDIQQLTPHSARMGAIEVSRREYLARLAVALDEPVSFNPWLGGDGSDR